MDIAHSVNRVPIRLTAERWSHIVNSHDEMAGYYDDCLEAIEEPDLVLPGTRGSLKRREPAQTVQVVGARHAVPNSPPSRSDETPVVRAGVADDNPAKSGRERDAAAEQGGTAGSMSTSPL